MCPLLLFCARDLSVFFFASPDAPTTHNLIYNFRASSLSLWVDALLLSTSAAQILPRQALDLPLDRTPPNLLHTIRLSGSQRDLLVTSSVTPVVFCLTVDLDDSGAFPEVCSYHTVQNPGLTLEHNSSSGQQNQHAHTFASAKRS